MLAGKDESENGSISPTIGSRIYTAIANQTLADWAGEAIVDVSVAALGEGVGLMSSIARAELTSLSGRKRSVIVKVIAQTENVGISKELNFTATRSISTGTSLISVLSPFPLVCSLISTLRPKTFADSGG